MCAAFQYYATPRHSFIETKIMTQKLPVGIQKSSDISRPFCSRLSVALTAGRVHLVRLVLVADSAFSVQTQLKRTIDQRSGTQEVMILEQTHPDFNPTGAGEMFILSSPNTLPKSEYCAQSSIV